MRYDIILLNNKPNIVQIKIDKTFNSTTAKPFQVSTDDNKSIIIFFLDLLITVEISKQFYHYIFL